MLTTNKQQFLDWLVECGNDLLALKDGNDLVLSICGNPGLVIADTGIIYEDENGEVCVARFESALDIEKYLQENGYYSNGITVSMSERVLTYDSPTKSFIDWLKEKKEGN